MPSKANAIAKAKANSNYSLISLRICFFDGLRSHSQGHVFPLPIGFSTLSHDFALSNFKILNTDINCKSHLINQTIRINKF